MIKVKLTVNINTQRAGKESGYPSIKIDVHSIRDDIMVYVKPVT